MYIDEKELTELVRKGALASDSKKFPIESLSSTIGFTISAFLAQFYLQSSLIKIAVWSFVLLNLVYFIYLITAYIKNRYTTDEFIKDIKKSSVIRNFSLIVIKDIHTNKYLLRYDRRWKCFLLPYQNTHEENDSEAVLKTVRNVYNLQNAEITVTKTDDITKYSYSDNVTKNYHHTFYFFELNNIDSTELSEEKINLHGEQFTWMSIDQMKCNKPIMKKNSETVDFIARNF